MAVAVRIKNVDIGLNTYQVVGTLTLTGNYGGAATHGDVLNWTQAVGVDLPANGVPLLVDIFEAPPAGTAPNGYIFNFNPGTNQTNGVLGILNNLTEYTQGSAYSAGLLAAVIMFEAIFARL
jgi:hypothetical protein